MDLDLLVILTAMLASQTTIQRIGHTETVHEWTVLDYDWPNDAARQRAIQNGDFIPENNVVTGIKLYKGEMYVTVSRWLNGVPSTMNRVIKKNGRSLLQPYPSWEWQNKDDCERFQFTQSMEIDPKTGYMWIIDTGRLNTRILSETINRCRPKLVIWDIINNRLVKKFTFPNSVASHKQNFLNDIVIDPIVGWAYITDAGFGASGHQGGLVVYNMNQDVAHRIEHSSMAYEPDGYNITINGRVYPLKLPINGIALSPDRSSLFYCPLGGYNLYQLPALAAQEQGSDVGPFVRNLGKKVSQAGGLLMGKRGLYFSATSLNAVYEWEYRKDMLDQDLPLSKVEMRTQTELSQDDVKLIWADTLALADDGWLYTTANQLPAFFEGELNFTVTSGPNFRIMRVYVNDTSYLSVVSDTLTGRGVPITGWFCNATILFIVEFLFLWHVLLL